MARPVLHATRLRMLLGALVLLAAAPVILSCGQGSSQRVRLRVGTFWGGASAEALHQELVTIGERMGPIAIEVRVYSLRALKEQLLRSQPAGGGENLDLAIVPNDWLGQLAERGIISELPENRVERLRRTLVSQALLAVTDGDRVLAYPVSAEVLALVYNAALLPTPPASIDALVRSQLPSGVLPFSINIGSPYHLAPLISCFQGELQDEDGSFLWRDEALTQVLQRLHPVWGGAEGWALSRTADLESVQLQLLAEGRLASFVTGPWLLRALEALRLDLGVAPIPPFENAPFPARPLVGYQSVVLTQVSPWSDLAHDVALGLLDTEVNDRLNRRTGRLPVSVRFYETSRAVSSPATIGFLRALEEGKVLPSSSAWEVGLNNASERLAHLTRLPEPPALADLPAILRGETP